MPFQLHKNLEKKTHPENKLNADLNRELKNIFTSCMNEAVVTGAMMSALPDDFNFTVDNLAAKLAEIFVVNDVSSLYRRRPENGVTHTRMSYLSNTD